jgi:hemerythrin-like domain-containing protein
MLPPFRNFEFWHGDCGDSPLCSKKEKTMPVQASSNVSDVLDKLREDHSKILHLFAEFRNIRSHADDETRRTLVEIVCTELVIHAQVEEELLYPALRDAFEDSSMVDEAGVEHLVARHLIGELESMHPDDELYDAKFTVLGEYVRHHIEEEQNKLFPKIKSSGIDLKALGREILQRREELRHEFGIPEDGYEDDGEDPRFHHHARWRFPHHH